jgi:transcriptional regulator with XRE-family HTH domain
MSQDDWTPRAYRVRMSDEAVFNEALIARVHRLRNDRGWTAQQMATALGVPAELYRKYEYRTPLPHYLIERIALIVGRDIEYILTGKTSPIRMAQPESRRKRA